VVSKFKRWMRMVLPPWWALVIAFSVLAVFFGLELSVSALISWKVDRSFDYVELPMRYGKFTGMLIPLYAIWRIMAFHPSFRVNYGKWLKTTPWTESKPLPLGPVHLVWQDVLFVGAITFACLPTDDWQIIPALFLLIYCMFFSFANLFAGVYWSVMVAFGLMATLFLVEGHVWISATILLATYGVCYSGFRQALHSYSWSESVRWELNLLKKLSSKQTTIWPLVDESAVGRIVFTRIAWKHVWGLSFFFGWLAFCFTQASLIESTLRGQEDVYASVKTMLLFMGWLCLMFRLCAYCTEHRPPLSLRGRLRTGRLIIPKYDQVLISPLAALAVSYVLPKLLLSWSVPLALVAFVSVFVILAVTFGGGPQLSQWQLAGEHRLSMKSPGAGWKQV